MYSPAVLSPATVRTGLPRLGEVSWGTHLCHFYRGRAELLEIVIPYLRAGLLGGERCLWITSPSLGIADARDALRAVLPDADDRERGGQLQLLSHEDWCLRHGTLDHDQLEKVWRQQETEALHRGHAGLRISAIASNLERRDWAALPCCAASASSCPPRLLALCSYGLEQCEAADVAEVMSRHNLALVRQAGAWDVVRSATLMLAATHWASNAQVQPAQSGLQLVAARPAGGHAVCFYDDTYPAVRIAAFLGESLRSGGGAILIAKTQNQPAITRALLDLGVSVDAAIECGRFVQVEAHAALESLMVDGVLQSARFESSIGTLVRQHVRRFGDARAYGEIVDILLGQGRNEDVIELEMFWNKLGATEPLSLLCGYRLAGFDNDNESNDFDRICGTHSTVVSTHDGHTHLDGKGNRLIAALKHKARVIARQSEHCRVLEEERDRLLASENALYQRAEMTIQHIGRLQKVTSALAETVSWSEIADVVVTEMASALEATSALLAVPIEAGTKLQLLRHVGLGKRPSGERSTVSVSADLPVTRAFRSMQAELCCADSWLATNDCLVECDLLGCGTAQTVVALPLRMFGEPLGVASFGFPPGRSFSPVDRAMFEDLTKQVSLAMDRVRLLQELQQARDRSQRLSQELAARVQSLETVQQQKADLMTYLAHDFRSPLFCIGLTVRQMLNHPALSVTEQQALRDVQTAAEQVQRMALDLIDVGRSDEGRLTPQLRRVDLLELIGQVTARTQAPALEKRQVLEWTADGGEPFVYCDEELLRRVLQNLLDNAVKCAPYGGRIHVELRAMDPASVQIRVTDNGPGVPPGQHERIFEKFAQLTGESASRARAGRGLGLTFCRSAVEAHGGRVWVEDAQPRGASFCVRLPRSGLHRPTPPSIPSASTTDVQARAPGGA